MTEEEIKLHKEKRRITTSFIFGILSIILFIFFPVALVFAIVGISWNRLTSPDVNGWMKITGFILDLIGIVGDGFLMLIFVAYYALGLNA